MRAGGPRHALTLIGAAAAMCAMTGCGAAEPSSSTRTGSGETVGAERAGDADGTESAHLGERAPSTDDAEIAATLEETVAEAVTDPAASASETHAAVRDLAAEREAERLLGIADAALENLRRLADDRELRSDMRTLSRRTATVVGAYAAVIEHRDVARSLAALLGSGEAYEILARAALDAPLGDGDESGRVIPLTPTPRPFAPPPGPEVDPSVRALVRAAREPEVRWIDCLGVYRYVLAVRVARRSALDHAPARTAAERLRARPAARVMECVELMRTGDHAHNIPADPSIEPYTPTELGPQPPSVPAN